MWKSKALLSLLLTITMLIMQTGASLAALALQEPDPIRGDVQTVTLATDTTTGVTIVTVTLVDKNEVFQTMRIPLKTAIVFGLVTLDGEGKAVINAALLGQSIELDPAVLIPEGGGNHHPIGNALASLFTSLPGIDYNAIMAVHNRGIGFGVITEALWLTKKLEGNSEVFRAILEARQSGDYTAFLLEDGTELKNWGQLRKAILDTGKKGNAEVILLHEDKENHLEEKNNGNNDGNDSGNDNNREKNREKNNNGNGNGSGQGNDGEKDKEKNKETNNNAGGNDKK